MRIKQVATSHLLLVASDLSAKVLDVPNSQSQRRGDPSKSHPVILNNSF